MRRVGKILGRAWWWVRQVSGDAAYENYLAWAARSAGCQDERHNRVVSREDFYLESLRRRYSGVSRCC